jgi:hypothetical protein
VISRAIEDETLLLKLDTGQVSLLNKVGGQVWELIDGSRNVGDIVQTLGQTYGVDQQEVQTDVEAFIAALLTRDMLAWEPGED